MSCIALSQGQSDSDISSTPVPSLVRHAVPVPGLRALFGTVEAKDSEGWLAQLAKEIGLRERENVSVEFWTFLTVGLSLILTSLCLRHSVQPFVRCYGGQRETDCCSSRIRFVGKTGSCSLFCPSASRVRLSFQTFRRPAMNPGSSPLSINERHQKPAGQG